MASHTIGEFPLPCPVPNQGTSPSASIPSMTTSACNTNMADNLMGYANNHNPSNAVRNASSMISSGGTFGSMSFTNLNPNHVASGLPAPPATSANAPAAAQATPPQQAARVSTPATSMISSGGSFGNVQFNNLNPNHVTASAAAPQPQQEQGQTAPQQAAPSTPANSMISSGGSFGNVQFNNLNPNAYSATQL